MQSRHAAPHYNPYPFRAAACPHAAAGVSPTTPSSTDIGTLDRGTRSFHLPNSVVLRILVLYRSTKPRFCFVYRSCRDAEQAMACWFGQ